MPDQASLMKLTTQDKIRIGFWLLSIVPIVLGIVAYRTTTSLYKSAEEVNEANSVIAHLGLLLANLKDLEVSQREFVLTGDKNRLETYRSNRKMFEGDVARLQKMVADDPYQTQRVKLLEEVIPQKFDELDKTVDLLEREGLDSASKLVTTNAGSRAMDDIASLIGSMRQAEQQTLSDYIPRQNRSLRATSVVFVIVVLVNGLVIGFVAFLVKRDRAERLREQENIRRINVELERRVEQRTRALKHSNEELQQFAYVVSHDLQEPLRMVGSYTELLQRRYKGKLDEDADQFISYAVDGVRRMTRLIHDLLEYSRVGASDTMDVEPVDSKSVLNTALSNLQARIQESRARISVGDLPAVQYDSTRLCQIFQNLVGNALKYHGDRTPEIQISAATENSDTVFAVKDNGIGIPPEHQDTIFGVFQRLHGREYEGTGIGLAMVKRIVERHGGRIWVASKPGEGSTFYFTVPQHDIPKAARAAS